MPRWNDGGRGDGYGAEEKSKVGGYRGQAGREYRDSVDIRRLGLGIVNIVNIFRPQLVLLGGGISKQGETLLAPLREIVKKEGFGGEKGDVPEIEAAELGNDAGMIGAAGLL